MINLELLKKQHTDIEGEVKEILKLTMDEDFENKLFDISLHINKLAGFLNMHLLSEDEYLYPALKEHEDAKLRSMADTYDSEMGDLVTEFNNYKMQYNTKFKLQANILKFRPATKEIMDKIQKRMDKENNNLYRLIAEKGI